MSDDNEFSTPCIGVCQYDNEDICRGCFRTLDEISNWALMTEEERKEIMKKLNKRAEKISDVNVLEDPDYFDAIDDINKA